LGAVTCDPAEIGKPWLPKGRLLDRKPERWCGFPWGRSDQWEATQGSLTMKEVAMVESKTTPEGWNSTCRSKDGCGVYI